MKESKKCETVGACWTHRSQVVGASFLVIASILTLLTLNGFGILGMFLVGIMLCRRKSMCTCPCCVSHPMMETHCSSGDEVEMHVKKKTMKKPAVKKEG